MLVRGLRKDEWRYRIGDAGTLLAFFNSFNAFNYNEAFTVTFLIHLFLLSVAVTWRIKKPSGGCRKWMTAQRSA